MGNQEGDANMSHSSRSSNKIGTPSEKPPKAAKKPAPRGKDRALSVPTTKGVAKHFTYWDLWFGLVATSNFQGDLLGLGRELASGRSVLYDRDSVERKQSHLLDLHRRLASAGLTIDQVIAAAGDLARTEKKRADKFVLDDSLRERDWSAAMRETPRGRRQREALRGAWPRFPVSPAPFAEEIRSKFKISGFYTESASSAVARKLDRFSERADKLLKMGRNAEAQALLRALMTVIIDLIEMADDSYGSIGDSFGVGFKLYLEIPLAETGIADDVFLPDLLDFLIWEDYGFTDGHTEGYFHKLTPEHSELCIAHLRRQIAELSDELLDHQAEEASTILCQVVVERNQIDQFENLAREMGSRHWRRIVQLVDHAVQKRKHELACRIFEAALTPGPHAEFLRKKYEQLKTGRWDPDPRK